MLTRWIPWRFLIKRAARAYGIIDPVTVLAHVRRFSQPSEIQEPIELVRNSIRFQARGLINTRAIQFNLDWVWPYWVEKQFNPRDPSFIPRAYSATHVNLTQRNWTAVGQPDVPLYPIVDPRGLVTPLFDGWSLDFWVVTATEKLLPSKLRDVEQSLRLEPDLAVATRSASNGLSLETLAWVVIEKREPRLVIQATGASGDGGWLAAVLRPYNPEGIQFIESIAFDPERREWIVDGRTSIAMDARPQKVLFSHYREGDVLLKLDEPERQHRVTCRVGMATSAALFAIPAGGRRRIEVSVPLADELEREYPGTAPASRTWSDVLAKRARLTVPDPRIAHLYECALRTLVLLSAHEPVPGPYTYRRFWFRDSVMMLNALLALGFIDRARRHIQAFPRRQTRAGYFQSQKGEWDSNGQVLWMIERFQQFADEGIDPPLLDAVLKGARWIDRKRIDPRRRVPHAGLLPAGFSAEHLGPNDYYYWDDYWAVAGLKAAALTAARAGLADVSGRLTAQSRGLADAIDKSIASIPSERRGGAIPASPYRRMDAGAVGSLVADYPLQLTEPQDPRIGRTVDFLVENCHFEGGFFQDMVHSGINPYLTLMVGQTLLRRGDERYRRAVRAVVRLASATGQWPEAMHPFSGGGCMGDGQHGWAAAEWIMMIRNLFVREENGGLILGSGILPEWLEQGGEMSIGPAPTPHGAISLSVTCKDTSASVVVRGAWHRGPPPMAVSVPGYKRVDVVTEGRTHVLEPA